MRIFLPHVVEGYEWVVPTSSPSIVLDGTPIQHRWSPRRFELVTETEDGELLKSSDFPWWNSNVLVLGPRALLALRRALEPIGEFLPLSVPGHSLYAFNATVIADALDPERSEIRRLSTGRVMTVDRYVFVPDRLPPHSVFRVPETARMLIYVNDMFTEAVERAGLEGLVFEEIWHA